MNESQQTDANTHYQAWGYTHKRRFASFWHQIDEILRTEPSALLEIGVGSGFLRQYLQHSGISLVTLDIAPELAPTCVGTGTHLPFQEEVFDVAVCFQVLEHMPYNQALITLRELHRVSRRWVIISVPDVNYTIRYDISLPSVALHSLISVKRVPTFKRPLTLDHCWEIGVAGLDVADLQRDIEACGYSVTKSYRVFENPFHRFFVLAKQPRTKP